MKGGELAACSTTRICLPRTCAKKRQTPFWKPPFSGLARGDCSASRGRNVSLRKNCFSFCNQYLKTQFFAAHELYCVTYFYRRNKSSQNSNTRQRRKENTPCFLFILKPFLISARWSKMAFRLNIHSGGGSWKTMSLRVGRWAKSAVTSAKTRRNLPFPAWGKLRETIYVESKYEWKPRSALKKVVV